LAIWRVEILFTSNSKTDINQKQTVFQFKTFCQEAILALVALIIVLALTESVLLMFNNFGYNGPDKIKKTNKFGSEIYHGMIWRKTEFEQIIHRNKIGLPAVEFDTIDGAQYKVVVIGGSFVEARQVPVNKNFPIQAQEMIPHVQFFPVGFAGNTLPMDYLVYRNIIPKIFGENGVYPSIDAVIFAVTNNDISYIAKGERDLGVSKPTFSWQRRLLKPVKEYLNPRLHNLWGSKYNIISLLSFKIYQLIEEDYFRSDPISPERYQWAKETYKNEVLKPLIALSKKNKTPIGFLYMPRIYEISNNDQDTKGTLREYIFTSLTELNLPYEDGANYFPNDKNLFFIKDTHPTEKGNYYLALALKALIQKHFYPNISRTQQ